MFHGLKFTEMNAQLSFFLQAKYLDILASPKNWEPGASNIRIIFSETSFLRRKTGRKGKQIYAFSEIKKECDGV